MLRDRFGRPIGRGDRAQVIRPSVGGHEREDVAPELRQLQALAELLGQLPLVGGRDPRLAQYGGELAVFPDQRGDARELGLELVGLVALAGQALRVAVNSVPVGPVGGTPISGATWTGEVPLTLGAGAARFAGDDRFMLTAGAGARVLVKDWLAVHLDMRDHVMEIDVFGKNKTSHNYEASVGVTAFF